jgi:hypothetical protein
LAWLDVFHAAWSLFRDGVSDEDIVEIYEADHSKDCPGLDSFLPTV